jgi:hypothetical protein
MRIPALLLIASCASALSAATHSITRYVAGGTSTGFSTVQVQLGDRVDVIIRPQVCWKITSDQLSDVDSIGWIRTGDVVYSLTNMSKVTNRQHAVRFFGTVERIPCETQGGGGGGETPTDWEVKGKVTRLRDCEGTDCDLARNPANTLVSKFDPLPVPIQGPGSLEVNANAVSIGGQHTSGPPMADNTAQAGSEFKVEPGLCPQGDNVAVTISHWGTAEGPCGGFAPPNRFIEMPSLTPAQQQNQLITGAWNNVYAHELGHERVLQTYVARMTTMLNILHVWGWSPDAGRATTIARARYYAEITNQVHDIQQQYYLANEAYEVATQHGDTQNAYDWGTQPPLADGTVNPNPHAPPPADE